VINIPANQLVGFEPDDKMTQPKSKANVEKIVAGLKKGVKLPPLLVRKYKDGYQVLDGHHRFWAYKLVGVKSIPAQLVPAKDIEEISKQGVAENFADGKNPQDKGDSKRYGINTKASVSSLRKTAKQGGRKGQLAHWLANMKAGKAK
jgi:ParB-like chromosome segregation protein Spo0J